MAESHWWLPLCGACVLATGDPEQSRMVYAACDVFGIHHECKRHGTWQTVQWIRTPESLRKNLHYETSRT